MECTQNFSFGAIWNLAVLRRVQLLSLGLIRIGWYYTFQGRFTKWRNPH